MSGNGNRSKWDGERVHFKGAKTYPANRKCSVCGATLSIYNSKDHCNSHDEPYDARPYIQISHLPQPEPRGRLLTTWHYYGPYRHEY